MGNRVLYLVFSPLNVRHTGKERETERETFPVKFIVNRSEDELELHKTDIYFNNSICKTPAVLHTV